MATFMNKRVRRSLALLQILALIILSAAANPQPTAAQGGPSDGIVCTTGPTFSLTTQSGFIGTPDDNVVFMWGFSAGSAGFQHPSPVLCVNQGDTVTVVLHNTLSEAVSLVFPGQENVLANGAPAQPQLSGSTITSLTPAAVTGGSMTYSFVAGRPGTFLYQSGSNPAKQVPMGLFGALIVRPTRNSVTNNYAYQTGDNEYKLNNEFLVLLSEIDPMLNQAVERGRNFNLNNYRPRYFMLNGRGFPDSIAANFASWLPTQPYGALVRINPYHPTANPLPALVRYINVTSQDIPFHPHGNHGRVVGRDGYPLTGTGSEDLSFEKFVVNLGPGQTWDATTNWQDAENYSLSNTVPITLPNVQNTFYGTFYGGSPYMGQTGPQPVGATTLNQCGEYYILAHNHSLFQITSWGIPMTGPISYLRIDPPLPNSCP